MSPWTLRLYMFATPCIAIGVGGWAAGHSVLLGVAVAALIATLAAGTIGYVDGIKTEQRRPVPIESIFTSWEAVQRARHGTILLSRHGQVFRVHADGDGYVALVTPTEWMPGVTISPAGEPAQTGRVGCEGLPYRAVGGAS